MLVLGNSAQVLFLSTSVLPTAKAVLPQSILFRLATLLPITGDPALISALVVSPDVTAGAFARFSPKVEADADLPIPTILRYTD